MSIDVYFVLFEANSSSCDLDKNCQSRNCIFSSLYLIKLYRCVTKVRAVNNEL